jgi:hypothetical protein
MTGLNQRHPRYNQKLKTSTGTYKAQQQFAIGNAAIATASAITNNLSILLFMTLTNILKTAEPLSVV